jgi:hypothetical protein
MEIRFASMRATDGGGAMNSRVAPACPDLAARTVRPGTENAVRARSETNCGPNSRSGPKSAIYDFLIEKYETKNPSKTHINTVQRPVLIEKKRKIPFSGPARPGGPPKGSSARKDRAEVPRRGTSESERKRTDAQQAVS